MNDTIDQGNRMRMPHSESVIPADRPHMPPYIVPEASLQKKEDCPPSLPPCSKGRKLPDCIRMKIRGVAYNVYSTYSEAGDLGEVYHQIILSRVLSHLCR